MNIVISILALYAYAIRDVWGQKKKGLMAMLLILASILISITGWLGGEAVYRYGIGVMRIPNADSHSHSGSESAGHDDGAMSGAHDGGPEKKPHDDLENLHGKAGSTHAH